MISLKGLEILIKDKGLYDSAYSWDSLGNLRDLVNDMAEKRKTTIDPSDTATQSGIFSGVYCPTNVESFFPYTGPLSISDLNVYQDDRLLDCTCNSQNITTCYCDLRTGCTCQSQQVVTCSTEAPVCDNYVLAHCSCNALHVCACQSRSSATCICNLRSCDCQLQVNCRFRSWLGCGCNRNCECNLRCFGQTWEAESCDCVSRSSCTCNTVLDCTCNTVTECSCDNRCNCNSVDYIA